MTKKTVVVLESNTSGNSVHIIKAAHKLGFETHYLTRDIKLWRNARSDPATHANRVSVVNTIDPVSMLDHIIDDTIAGIIWPDEIRLIPAVMLGAAKGIITPSQIKAFHTIRFKDLVREICNRYSSEVPYAVVNSNHFGDSSPVGYPCVVKPVDESGSFGVRRCDNDIDYQEACAFLAANNTHISGYQKAQRLIIEKYVDGEEFSAEMVWHIEQGWCLIGFTRKLKGIEPFFVEVGHIFPHEFERDIEEHIKSTLRTCLDAIGLEKSVAHVEFKITNGKVAIIEINPRLPGDLIVELVKLSRGIDLGRLTCLAHLGLPWTLPSERTKLEIYASVAFICAKTSGIITGLTSKHGADVVWLQSIPTKVSGLKSSADRLGCAIATGNKPMAAWHAAEDIASQVLIDVCQSEASTLSID